MSAESERDEAVELLREAVWMHGMIDPPHPDWSSVQHEMAEEDWLRDRVFPWLILHGYHDRPFDPDAPFDLLRGVPQKAKQ